MCSAGEHKSSERPQHMLTDLELIPVYIYHSLEDKCKNILPDGLKHCMVNLWYIVVISSRIVKIVSVIQQDYVFKQIEISQRNLSWDFDLKLNRNWQHALEDLEVFGFGAWQMWSRQKSWYDYSTFSTVKQHAPSRAGWFKTIAFILL